MLLNQTCCLDLTAQPGGQHLVPLRVATKAPSSNCVLDPLSKQCHLFPGETLCDLVQACVALRVKTISLTDGALKNPESVLRDCAIVLETMVP